MTQQVNQLGGQERLLLSVVEQLSRPLLQLSRLAEWQVGNPTSGDNIARWQTVQTVATSSLQLVEGYSLSLRLHGKLTPLELEPVTISSLLYDAAQALDPYAKERGVKLELDTGPRLAPVLVDRQVLRSVFLSLGQVFVEGGSEQTATATVRLAAHRSRYGVVAGLYSSLHDLSVESLRQARQLQGRARQPLQRLISGPGAGVFVADSLLQNLQSHLHVAKYHNLTGLATTLPPSQQLQLV